MINILNNTIFNPQELIAYLKSKNDLSQVYQQRVRHYTLERHTLLVMSEFEKYFGNVELPIGKELFRLILALHDIGKPQAFEEGDKNNQYKYTVTKINHMRNSLPFSNLDIDLCITLVSSDILGLYLQNKINLETAKNQIISLASKTNLTILAFFKLMTVYYQCDTARGAFQIVA